MITITDFQAMPAWQLNCIETKLRSIHNWPHHLSIFDTYQLFLSTTAGQIAMMSRKDRKFMCRLIKELSK
jgi:hypothetical protein